jgi:hypothetical protein
MRRIGPRRAPVGWNSRDKGGSRCRLSLTLHPTPARVCRARWVTVSIEPLHGASIGAVVKGST